MVYDVTFAYTFFRFYVAIVFNPRLIIHTFPGSSVSFLFCSVNALACFVIPLASRLIHTSVPSSGMSHLICSAAAIIRIHLSSSLYSSTLSPPLFISIIFFLEKVFVLLLVNSMEK
ncbi:hypothetical protein RvY_13050 [Ramazzottius varieornatus]|uniref:Uncharacterized protein n=1 Tax=Ramazzottius varieornatus TaxID=947166 RepID=A0A1D1VLK0_RAMVA|nr:hypothetical protein RvY_13050 [Ramazzottius varieornatus]